MVDFKKQMYCNAIFIYFLPSLALNFLTKLDDYERIV